jgi:hypothetical protein
MSQEQIVQLDTAYAEKLLNPELKLPMINVTQFIEARKVPDNIDELWIANYLENKERIRPFPRTQIGLGKAAIMVGASPALKKNYEILKEIDDKFILVCSPTTLKFLQEKEIRIDYVFALEGRKHWLDDIDCDTSKLTLIASPFIYPEALRRWQGEVWFYMIGGGKNYNELILKDWPGMNIEVGGGNAISTGFLWAYKFLTCRHFVFCGMSLCYYDDYYFDGRPQQVDNLDKWNDWLYAMDIKGNVVRTTPSLISYKCWLEMAMEKSPNAEFVNATEDGILGVWPEPAKVENGILYGRRKFLPWINVLPLNLTINAYKEKLNGTRK